MKISSIEQLEDVLTSPSPELIESIAQWRGNLMIVGAGGKMGPTLTMLAKRALEAAQSDLQITVVSRFADSKARGWFEDRGIATIAADVLEPREVEKLPEAEQIIYLVGLKFGTTSNPGATWAANTLAPASIIRRCPSSRIVALSSGNVYPFVDSHGPGASEDFPLTPIGEYPNAAVARERIFEYFSQKQQTPTVNMRLNYALDLRYGVLVDIASKIWRNEAISLVMGYFNAIWQGDANDLILRSLSLTQVPATAYNLTSSEKYSVRDVAMRLGELLGKQPRFEGTESRTALLSNCSRLYERLKPPSTSLDRVMEWTADWIASGRPLLGKPTHFETRDGVY